MAGAAATRDASDTGQMTRGPAPVWRHIIVLVNSTVRSTWTARSKEGADSFIYGMSAFFGQIAPQRAVEFRAYRTLRAFRAAVAAFKRRAAQ